MIVIPMAGSSRRFTVAGYDKPKYLLPLGRCSVFEHAVRSFSHYFATEKCVFVLRDIEGTARFVEDIANKLQIRHARIVVLRDETRGQAMTVSIGLERIGCSATEPVTIFNIDTYRPHLRYPSLVSLPLLSGFIEVFRGSGSNWSYVRPSVDTPGRVLETTEKRPISDLCCTGLYHFATARLFDCAFAQALREECANPEVELYVAPMYNYLIQDGHDIRYVEIDLSEVVFCGTPEEYEQLRKSLFR